MKTILISAYGCEPLKGSEPGVGWNWVLQMAKTNKLHVITRANNRELIENYLPEECAPNITFHYYDAPYFVRRLKNKAKGLYFYYSCWQLGIIPIIKKILKEHDIDYSMHLSFGSMWMPTFLPLFRVPFIWGPVGGGECGSPKLIRLWPFRLRLLQYIRYLINTVSFLNPFVLLPSLKAKVILCRTGSTLKAMPFFTRYKARIILETAMENSFFNRQYTNKKEKCIHIVTTGQLIPRKNILTAIRALAQLPKKLQFSYVVYGSGPQRHCIEEEITQLGLQNKIRLVKEIPREQLMNELERADIFLFPSLSEGGSWSLMEAMAIGLPVICLNWAGMAVSTDDSCAIRLPVTNPEQMVHDMTEAIVRLAGNPELRRQMGEAGRKRIQEVFNWESKGTFMEELFEELEQGNVKRHES